ncbi:hypothetical protein CVT24_008351 [Panaeolus cyanescens]|uniref:F-box domain-containing protein n=1 Tax=Panaeolus cyanescens TaxID=181874 RepID=A0A409VC31_9AGAR|nr:hypothetical protein CVT24_008351 [Panaeolus cyanescens]
MRFDNLPVDLIAEILGNLDLESLISASYVSRRLYSVAADPSLNPWRRPIYDNLLTGNYETALKHLSVRHVVPRQNWIAILSTARPSFIIFQSTLPNLRSSEWELCFRRRFLPSWHKFRKDASWKEAFLKSIHRVWHRSTTSCSVDEAWTKYIVLNRNGSANQLEGSSRSYNPFAIFNQLKTQSNLSHLDTRMRVVVDIADVQILAFGTLGKPRNHHAVNSNAHLFLNPPGVYVNNSAPFKDPSSTTRINDHGVYPRSKFITPTYLFTEYNSPSTTYSRMQEPQPSPCNRQYPFFTPGGGDLRWRDLDEMEEQGFHWMGSLMIVAQLKGSSHLDNVNESRPHYVSFTWEDLWAISPWLEGVITKRINGAGLGH